MTKKYYAVRAGFKPGIYESWEECREQVDGYPSSEYQSFKTLEEAENYMDGVNLEEVNKEEQSIEIERYDKPAEKEYTKGKTYNEIGADETGKVFYGPMVTAAVYYGDRFNQDIFDELDKLPSTDSKNISPEKLEDIALELMKPANKLKFTIVEAIGDYSNPEKKYEFDSRWDYDEIHKAILKKPSTKQHNAVQAFGINQAIQLLIDKIDEFGAPDTITYDRFVGNDTTYENYLKGKGNHMNGKSIIDVIDGSRIIGVKAKDQADDDKNSPSAAASIIAKYVRNEFLKFVNEKYPVKDEETGEKIPMPDNDTEQEEIKKYGVLFIKEYGKETFDKFAKTTKKPYNEIIRLAKEEGVL